MQNMMMDLQSFNVIGAVPQRIKTTVCCIKFKNSNTTYCGKVF